MENDISPAHALFGEIRYSGHYSHGGRAQARFLHRNVQVWKKERMMGNTEGDYGSLLDGGVERFVEQGIQKQYMADLKKRFDTLKASRLGDGELTSLEEWSHALWMDGPKAKVGTLYSITSAGGDFRTYLNFAAFTGIYEGRTEELFYQLLLLKRGPLLRLCQYALDAKGNQDLLDIKLGRLGRYRRIFSAACETNAWHSLAFDEPKNRAKDNSEVAVLFFDAKRNSPRNVLDQLPRIHEAFIAALSKSDLTPVAQ